MCPRDASQTRLVHFCSPSKIFPPTTTSSSSLPYFGLKLTVGCCFGYYNRPRIFRPLSVHVRTSCLGNRSCWSKDGGIFLPTVESRYRRGGKTSLEFGFDQVFPLSDLRDLLQMCKERNVLLHDRPTTDSSCPQRNSCSLLLSLSNPKIFSTDFFFSPLPPSPSSLSPSPSPPPFLFATDGGPCLSDGEWARGRPLMFSGL